MLYAALADVAGIVPGAAGRVLTGLAAEQSSGGDLWLQLFDAATARDALQLTAARLCAVGALVDNGWVAAGAGVGATLTSPTDVTSHNDFDGTTANLNDRILVKDEAAADLAQNGVYAITTLADGAGQEAILTRVTDFDQVAEIVVDALIRVTAGATLAGTAWRLTTAPETVDTEPLVWAASWTPLVAPLLVATATRQRLELERLTRGGLAAFPTGIAWGWSSARDTFVPYTGAAANVAAWLYHRAP